MARQRKTRAAAPPVETPAPVEKTYEPVKIGSITIELHDEDYHLMYGKKLDLGETPDLETAKKVARRVRAPAMRIVAGFAVLTDAAKAQIEAAFAAYNPQPM